MLQILSGASEVKLRKTETAKYEGDSRTQVLNEVKKPQTLHKTKEKDHRGSISNRNKLLGAIKKKASLGDASKELAEAEAATKKAAREAYFAAKYGTN